LQKTNMVKPFCGEYPRPGWWRFPPSTTCALPPTVGGQSLAASGSNLTRYVGIDILTVGIEGKEMANSSIISTKGQVTVPKKIRTWLGLRVGDRIEFVVKGKDTLIRPVRSSGNPFEKYIGVLGPFPGGLKGINASIRSMRDDEE